MHIPLATVLTVSRWPEPIRLDSIRIPPSSIIGKVLVRIRPSPTHPSVNLDFEDETTFQIRVDGYNLVHSTYPQDKLSVKQTLCTVRSVPFGFHSN